MKGGLHDHPDSVEFKYRLRDYILGKHEGDLPIEANIIEDDTPNIEGLPEKILCNSIHTIKSDESNINICDNNAKEVEYEMSDINYDGLEFLENLNRFLWSILEIRLILNPII